MITSKNSGAHFCRAFCHRMAYISCTNRVEFLLCDDIGGEEAKSRRALAVRKVSADKATQQKDEQDVQVIFFTIP
jgi:hypothetical protein